MFQNNSNKNPAVLTSDIINEAQALFQQRSFKREGYEPLASQNDLLFILRGIGMNPTQPDLEEVVSFMSIYDADEKRDDRKKKKNKEEEDKKKKKDEDDEKAKIMQLPEDIPKYSWLTLIEAIELGYKNHRRCVDEIVSCLKVFEPGPRISVRNLVHIMTSLGDDVLGPLEIEELKRLFTNPDVPADDSVEIDFEAFAKTVQEGQKPPPPPPPPQEEGAAGETAGSRKPSAA